MPFEDIVQHAPSYINDSCTGCATMPIIPFHLHFTQLLLPNAMVKIFNFHPGAKTIGYDFNFCILLL